jgi:crossover junction endodeoxyribonuclease RuvC
MTSLCLNDWRRLVAGEVGVLSQDNGLKGAIAFGRPSGELVAIIDMPVIPDGAKNRKTICAPLLAEIYTCPHATALYIESGGVRPGEGALGALTQGRGIGIAIGIAAAISLPVTTLSPQRWRRAVGLAPGADKNFSRSEAIRRWPQHASWFARVSDHGRSDAALIFAAGLLQNGGPK